ncbi:MAG: transposase [Bacteroidales bacterium]
MPDYRRYYIPNSCVFITVVTKNRIPYFNSRENQDIYLKTLEIVKTLYSFELLAFVILPDHFHWIIHPMDDQNNFSQVVHSFKRNCTNNFKVLHSISDSFSLWQQRFWDHVIRDEIDMKNHLDYIHWNPVKHNIVSVPDDYSLSSFHEFVKQGWYPPNWGEGEVPINVKNLCFE